MTKAGWLPPRWCTAWHAYNHLLIQLTCPQLTCFPHLTAAGGARTGFLGQSQPTGIPPAKPDAMWMQAPWETLAQQSLLSLWFGCGNYPRRSKNSPGKVYHSQHTKPALNQEMFQSAHSITGTSNQEGAGAGPEDNFVAIENVLERTRCYIIIFSSLRTCLQN